MSTIGKYDFLAEGETIRVQMTGTGKDKGMVVGTGDKGQSFAEWLKARFCGYIEKDAEGRFIYHCRAISDLGQAAVNQVFAQEFFTT